MKLEQYLDTAKLFAYIANGTVEQRFHNTLPLSILCYGRKATYEDIWDDVTCKTRGLIFETATGEIVARPFEKFFNLNHTGRPETSFVELAKESRFPYAADKLDGSMGTLWEYEGQFGIATKGSFHSEQADWATAWINEHYRKDWGIVRCWPEGFTPIFEIINQSIQHHVIHYEPQDDNQLVLIGMVNIDSGEELAAGVLEICGKVNGIKVAESTTAHWDNSGDNVQLLLSLENYRRPNKEGWVLSYPREGKPPLKVKVKHEEFLKLQRIAHYTTPQVVYEYCRDGRTDLIDEAIKYASPWLSSQVKEWVTNYQDAHGRLTTEARRLVKEALHMFTERKEFARYFNLHANVYYAPICFNILDDKDYKATAWKLVEPVVKLQKFSPVEEEA